MVAMTRENSASSLSPSLNHLLRQDLYTPWRWRTWVNGHFLRKGCCKLIQRWVVNAHSGQQVKCSLVAKEGCVINSIYQCVYVSTTNPEQ